MESLTGILWWGCGDRSGDQHEVDEDGSEGLDEDGREDVEASDDTDDESDDVEVSDDADDEPEDICKVDGRK